MDEMKRQEQISCSPRVVLYSALRLYAVAAGDFVIREQLVCSRRLWNLFCNLGKLKFAVYMRVRACVLVDSIAAERSRAKKLIGSAIFSPGETRFRHIQFCATLRSARRRLCTLRAESYGNARRFKISLL
jgi:hypothetical protein